MDRTEPGSVQRARERAAAGLPRGATPPEAPQMARPSAPRQPTTGTTSGLPRAVRPQAPSGLQTRDGQIGVAISRPSPAPQWPLQEPILAPAQVDGQPFRPPPGKSQPPQRPPRPSRVPSILDASKVQDHTPVFQYRPRSGSDSTGQELLTVPETPSNTSRPSTMSSVGTIPDFPLPTQGPAAPARRSVNLGPPPSARRGASSFYSNASFVSPIPEESPRARSHTSYASSAAMPENWGSPSPGPSPDFPDPVYGEPIAEESAYGDDDAEESRLVRSASLGKRAKPTLVNAASSRGMDSGTRDQRPAPQPTQGALRDGTGSLENSSSSGAIPAAMRLPIGVAIAPDTMLDAYSSASADDPSTSSQRTTPSPNPTAGSRSYSRLSAIRRPPRLDLDAVRKAEARGSLTSLPDLIRRATRLAASLEKGRRPASRIDDLDDFPDYAFDGEKHQSGLSDMLAAFPPPSHLAPTQTRRGFRDSMREQVQSWPIPLTFNRTLNTSQEAGPNSDSPRSIRKKGRRCCGLPLWGFIMVIAAIVILIAAAVVIPVEFFVVRKQNGGGSAQQDLQDCQQQLACANGGTNVVTEGVCSCRCTSGFTGVKCDVADTTGCTTISLTGSNNNITVGDAIPRLIQQAQTNFSIPLSANEILPKLESGNLSCSAENALVTFDGRATRQALVVQPDTVNAAAAGAVVDGVFYTTITIVIAPLTTFTLGAPFFTTTTAAAGTSFTTSFTSGFATTISVGRTSTRSATATSKVTTTMSMPSAAPTAAFTASEDALDFARVAVLFILQKDSLADAETAQMTLQRFLGSGGGITVGAAQNVTLGGGRSIDLVDFVLDMGGSDGRVGLTSAAVRARGIAAGWASRPPPVLTKRKRRGIVDTT